MIFFEKIIIDGNINYENNFDFFRPKRPFLDYFARFYHLRLLQSKLHDWLKCLVLNPIKDPHPNTKNNHKFEPLVLALVHEYFDTAKSSRPNCIPSYITIVSHIAMISAKSKQSRQEHSKTYLMDELIKFTRGGLGQQFRPRVFGKIFFTK